MTLEIGEMINRGKKPEAVVPNSQRPTYTGYGFGK
jgi:hypothetical protein